jgi:hypothetical protein
MIGLSALVRPPKLANSLALQKKDIETHWALHMEGVYLDQFVDERRRPAISANDGWAFRHLIGGVG